MNLLTAVLTWANQQTIDCHSCTHPSNKCSGGCQDCLNEIHYWHGKPKENRRADYNCKRLACEYVKTFAERYFWNIKSACKDIDFNNYDEIHILSIGCGVSPDLMAFEELAKGSNIKYRGIDISDQYGEFQDVIRSYVHEKNIQFDFELRDVLNPEEGQSRTDIYNVIVMQYFISSALGAGWQRREILALFSDLVDVVLSRWYESESTSPFLFILNDADSLNTGRDCFFKLIDILEEKGYSGAAYAYSSHTTGDLGRQRWSLRKEKEGYENIRYSYSSCTSNGSAALTIEVTK